MLTNPADGSYNITTLCPEAQQRIAALREDILLLQMRENNVELEKYVIGSQVLAALPVETSRPALHAEVVFQRLTRMTPLIQQGELIVGRMRYVETEADAEELKQANQLPNPHPSTRGMAGHMTIDEGALLRDGVTGTLARIDEYAHQYVDDPERQEFYRACRGVLDGVLIAAEHYRAQAEALATACNDPVQAEEYRQIACTLAQVPCHEARSVREALQSHFFLIYCLRMESYGHVPGRLDQWLYPYYQMDKERGVSDEEILELLCAYYLKYNELHGTWPSSVMVGGQREDGQDVTNPLSYLCLDAMEAVNLVNPALAISCHPGSPDALLLRGCDLLIQGYARPAFFNDDVIIPGMVHAGCTRAEAINYIHSTCVEITPGGCSNVWVASPYVNLVAPLEWLLNRGQSFLVSNPASGLDLGPLEQFTTFESFLDAYKQQLSALIEHAVNEQIALRQQRWDYNCFPLLSCFVCDCLERGKDIDRGGARHNWVMPSHVGLANLVDSLTIIRESVYQRGTHTLDALRELLLDAEKVDERQLLAHTIIPYGNDCVQTDAVAIAITKFIAETYYHHREPVLDSTFHPGYFCWMMHAWLGQQTGASIDGREAGAVLADGAGSAQGRDRGGPTAAINSVTQWNHTPCLGGTALNLKFSAGTLLDTSGRQVLLALIKSFMAQGGFEIQINVLHAEALQHAKVQPEQYRDLVVRVAGFSEYFVKLPSEIQEEVIARTMHSGG